MFLLSSVLFTHWVGDFVCQTNWMAFNKNKNLFALIIHTLTYSTILLCGSLLGVYLFSKLGAQSNANINFAVISFIVLNGLLHGVTDYFTSRISSELYKSDNKHNFFSMVGLDQLIHQVTLLFTVQYFLI